MPKYTRSDLVISSTNIQIRFLNLTFSQDEYATISVPDFKETQYCNALIIARTELTSVFSKFVASTGEQYYYHCLYKNYEIESLQKILEEACSSFPRSKYKEETYQQPAKCQTTDIFRVVESCLSADNIIITFGAGLSAGYIPTLLEFANALELEKLEAKDCFTDISMKKLIGNLCSEQSKLWLNKVRMIWLSVHNIEPKIVSTPAHLALLNCGKLLEEHDKQVLFYTDNIDGIHNAVGIKLARIKISDGEQLVYTDEDLLLGKTTVILVCGQSFDFDYVLSTLHTQQEYIKMNGLKFFSFNVNTDSLIVTKIDAHRELQRMSEDASYSLPDVEGLQKQSLTTMGCVQGSCHKTLPNLYEILRIRLLSVCDSKKMQTNPAAPITWLRDSSKEEEVTFEQFAKDYRITHPDAEAHGYGPGALICRPSQ